MRGISVGHFNNIFDLSIIIIEVLAAFCEPAGSYNRLSYVLYVFEQKTQYLLIHAP